MKQETRIFQQKFVDFNLYAKNDEKHFTKLVKKKT